MTNDQGRPLDWNDDVEDDGSGGFTLLPPGNYPFEVKFFKRGWFSPTPNGKIKEGCNKALLDLEVDGGAEGTLNIKEHQILCHSRCSGFVREFFVSTGLIAPDATKFNLGFFESAVGRRGMVRIGQQESNKNPGKMFNRVEEFLPPQQGQTAPPPPQQQQYAQPQPTQYAPPPQYAPQPQQQAAPATDDELPF